MPNRNTVVAPEYTYGDDFRRVKNVLINNVRELMIEIADAKLEFKERTGREPSRLYINAWRRRLLTEAACKKLLRFTVANKTRPTHFTGLEIRVTRLEKVYVK